eukprot:scaffold120630_cov17-Prasinocladus_malaysianus.AAC.1
MGRFLPANIVIIGNGNSAPHIQDFLTSKKNSGDEPMARQIVKASHYHKLCEGKIITLILPG